MVYRVKYNINISIGRVMFINGSQVIICKVIKWINWIGDKKLLLIIYFKNRGIICRMGQTFSSVLKWVEWSYGAEAEFFLCNLFWNLLLKYLKYVFDESLLSIFFGDKISHSEHCWL